MPGPIIDLSSRLQDLTFEYARFSRSAGGLSSVIGGLLGLVAYFLSHALPASPGLRVALIGIPLLWLVCKQGLARRYYQRLGQVEGLSTDSEQRIRKWLAGCTALISALILWRAMHSGMLFSQQLADPGAVAYLCIVGLMPAIAWRWLGNPLDFCIGVLLLCQAALAVTGQSYPIWSSALILPIAALLLIVGGVREHLRFTRVQAEIHSILREQRTAE